MLASLECAGASAGAGFPACLRRLCLLVSLVLALRSADLVAGPGFLGLESGRGGCKGGFVEPTTGLGKLKGRNRLL